MARGYFPGLQVMDTSPPSRGNMLESLSLLSRSVLCEGDGPPTNLKSGQQVSLLIHWLPGHPWHERAVPRAIFLELGLAALLLSWHGSSPILLCIYLFGCLGSSLHKWDLLLSRTDSSCGARVPDLVGSVVEARGLSCLVTCGILVPRPGIKPIVSCFARQILNHWTTREVPERLFSGYNSQFGLNKIFHFFLRSTDEIFHHNDNVGNSKLLESANCCTHYLGGLTAGWGVISCFTGEGV